MSTISSGTTLTTALVQVGDTTGDLIVKTGASNTTAMTISGTDQSVTLVGSLTANTNASTITTGTIATARLATGTANASTYLRGDQTWATIAGSQWVTSGANISYTTGSVGIGTSSPTTKMQISGLTGANGLSIAARTDVTDNSGNLFFTDSGGTVCIKSATGALLFNTGATVGSGSGTERMRIAAGGAVTIRNNIASNNALELGNTNTGTGTSFGVKFAGGTNASDYCISGDNAASTVNLFNFRGNGDFQFNSGYGSAATAYGCRAWVNFNGTGTVAMRANGNVSSIGDNGTGDYTVNFSTAMPDVNYAVVGSTCSDTSTDGRCVLTTRGTSGGGATDQLTTSVRILTAYTNGSATRDFGSVYCSVFR
jgi:hypothetical protein